MPSTLTYPGVYIEEVPSGVRAISGVATSIAAFIGWAARGPADRAQLVQSWTDFERRFGGLNRQSLLGYAVQQFFTNGGQQAYVVRLHAGDADTATVSVPSADAGTSLDFSASSPGEWANQYAVAIRRRTDDPTRFRLTVVEVNAAGDETPVESFENLSLDSLDRRFVETVVNELSQFVRVQVNGPSTTPPLDTASPSPLLGSDTPGDDGTVLDPDTAGFEAALEAGGGNGGVNLLERVDLFNLLSVPGQTTPAVVAQLQAFCRRQRAFYIADCAESDDFNSLMGGPDGAITGADGVNAAYYFPWVLAPDPLQENRPRAFPPSGFVAGLFARTDTTRGVWKAPAGTEASVSGASGLTEVLTDLENGTLNIQAINCLRRFNVYGNVVWGARTLAGHDDRGSEWKYVPVRRIALYIEESLYRGTQWVVFEPNDEKLWSQIRLNIGAFMQGLFRQGAFQGTSPRDAYFVKCDSDTTTQADIDRGIVNIHVGFAPLKPAEFVVLRIQQIAGQAES
ncbi:MAG: phage tail sheath family protein [Puniceicoccaceae bacterium 5H]|nr:MAG: phage tail sheath family protein [Puniceicoccaceae bacterium 5H]